ncbi:MAG TPA: hypothetical protein VFT44_03320 [Pyrinomonadaceae bacterium]|nr:hypothetical protein [Pyrinomonadaceae bacterium]
MRTGIDKQNNWREIWETVREVTPEQWEDIKERLRQSHAKALPPSTLSSDGMVNTTSWVRYRYSFILLTTSVGFV